MTTHPKLTIVNQPTPLVRANNLSERLGIDLHIKRDDLAGPTFGGNKSRHLEYYFGDAIAQGADTILITGAVQSNFVRLAAAVAATQGMRCIVQLEDRVDGKGERYHTAGNVLLSKVLGAEIMHYAVGEDEHGADAALHARADAVKAEGGVPYVIHLSEGPPPWGALGYMDAVREILAQGDDFDFYVTASGSGLTHAGLMAGLRDAGSSARVIGSCNRRGVAEQGPRMRRVVDRLAKLHPGAEKVTDEDIIVWDGALAPGYGKASDASRNAIRTMARSEGLILDPVYTGKSFAAVLAWVKSGDIPPGSRVCYLHTGGLGALSAYEDEMAALA